jgi:DNA modification methylase
MNKSLIDRDFIENIKNDSKNLSSFMKGQNEGNVIHLLNKIGRLDENFNKDSLMPLLESENEDIRALAIKNLAKLEDVGLLAIFLAKAKDDKSTTVRREAVSAIGRLRNQKTIPFLIELLHDSDPKVVMQAIRGLLVFKYNQEVRMRLKKLLSHPNEMIKEVINKELNGSNHISKSSLKHNESPVFLQNVVVHADVLEALKYVEEESVHLTFTSPPYYNARDYSIYQSYGEYLNFLERVFKEVHRITKEGRFFILNTSPIIIPRVSRQHSSRRYPIPFDIHPRLVSMGWEFIDDIIWVKPEASVKNRNAGFLQHRKPLAYKPNSVSEMLMVYRKKTDKLIDWNIEQYDWETIKKSKVADNYETTNVWKIDPTFDKTHTAVFPIELCNRFIKFYSYEGDLVFDPFAGSGTLGRAAINLNRYFFLVDKEERYFLRMKETLNKSGSLFLKNKLPQFFDIKNFIARAKNDSNGKGN